MGFTEPWRRPSATKMIALRRFGASCASTTQRTQRTPGTPRTIQTPRTPRTIRTIRTLRTLVQFFEDRSETSSCRTKIFRQHARLADSRHEVRVARPSRHQMDVQVILDARACGLAEINPDVDP